jgi:hypothetical protein
MYRVRGVRGVKKINKKQHRNPINSKLAGVNSPLEIEDSTIPKFNNVLS